MGRFRTDRPGHLLGEAEVALRRRADRVVAPVLTDRPSTGEPPPALRADVEAALGARTLTWTRPTTGLSSAHRFVVELADGAPVFVKAATTEETARWLRNEVVALRGAPAALAPVVHAWIEAPLPILVVESLAGRWPAGDGGVEWRPGELDRVLAAIRQLAAAPAPRELPALEPRQDDAWAAILDSPEPFLPLELCSGAWLAENGDELRRAAARADTSGETFVHGDIRSDNICMTPDGVKLVDWSHAGRGAAELDLVQFLPTAHLEGGPAPHDVYPAGGGWAAAQAARLARRVLTDAAAPEWLRRVLLRLVAIDLDWACAGLGLTPRDGKDWRAL